MRHLLAIPIDECVYCHVPSVLKISREEFSAGAVVRDNFIENLIKDAGGRHC
jgi:hypothetical protein